MNPRTTPQVARQAIFAIRGARYSSTTAVPESTQSAPEAPSTRQEASEPESKVGQQIYVYHHLQKKNVVYSFNRALKNSHALAQIPFNGKKTVPRALRKDLWHPLATLIFPTASPQIGLSTFQKLREYRRRHELEWDPEQYKKDEDGKPITKKKQGRLLADQKANSIADIAAVLNRLSKSFVEEAGEEDKSVGKIGLIGEGTGTEVKVEWSNPYDRGFAESWSSNVRHSTLEPHTNNRDPGGESAKKERDGETGIKVRSQKEKRNAKYKGARPYICAAWHKSLPRSEKLALQEKARLTRERRKEPEYQENLKQQRMERYREKKRKEEAPKRAELWQSLSEEEKAAKIIEIAARKAAKEAKRQAALEKITV